MINKHQLIIDYIPLAKSIAKKYKTLNYDDRYQEALLGLVQAAEHFDEEKGEFGPFARVVIKNRLNKSYNDMKDTPLSIDFENNEDDSRNYLEKYIADVEENYEMIEYFMAIKNSCGITAVIIAKMLFAGKTQSECAKILNISQPTVSRYISQIRNNKMKIMGVK